MAAFRDAGIWLCFSEDLARDFKLFAFLLQLPQVLTELSLSSPLFVPKRHLMVSVSCYKLISCETDVCFIRISGCNCGLIYNLICQALSILWALLFFSTVARLSFVLLLLCCFKALQYGFLMAIY